MHPLFANALQELNYEDLIHNYDYTFYISKWKQLKKFNESTNKRVYYIVSAMQLENHV